jgi:hypothetical protein
MEQEWTRADLSANTEEERRLRQNRAMSDVLAERDAQEERWGEQNHHPAYWLAIMGKQVGQFGSAVLQREWWVDTQAALGIMRREAVQMTAVGLAIIEAIDRGNMPQGLVTAKPGDPRQLAKALDHGHESIDYDPEPETSLTEAQDG